METGESERFYKLVALIKEVKPGVADVTIKPEDSLVETLGLDSLDILQLSRKINRQIGVFDLDAWMASSTKTVQFIMDSIQMTDATTTA